MRETVVRAIAGLFAFGWIVLPGFGAIDLAVTWNSDWPQVLEAGWGLFFTALVGAAFVLVATRPRACGPGLIQLVLTSGALAVSAAVADEPPLFWLAAALALETAIVGGLSRRPRRGVGVAQMPTGVSRPLLLLAGLGVVPWLAYAVDMWRLNRDGRIDADITIGVDHYAVQGALGLALAVLPFVAALRSDVRPFIPLCTGIAASYLGLISFVWSEAAGGFGRAWSAAAIAWGLALVAVPLVERLRTTPVRAGDHARAP